MRPRFAMTMGLIAVVALAACNAGAAGTPTSAATAGVPQTSSGSATCRSAPEPADLSAWKPPTTTPPVYPQIVANEGELTCGRMRLLFSFLDRANNVLASPDRSVTVAIYDLGRDPNTPITSADATFIWAIQDVRGIYVATIDFPEAGTYGAEFTTAQGVGSSTTLRMTFDVSATTSLIQVGQKAPSTKTPTAADSGGNLNRISTDPSPAPAFYQVSEDQALAKHQPFVLIFATPKFCTSSQCGPTLDRIKPFATTYPSVAFIHVEPYELSYENGTLNAVVTNGGLTPTAATNAWGLSSEPWVFVVDRDGIVRGSFGLIFSDAELTSALDAVK